MSQSTDPAVLADLGHKARVTFGKSEDYRATFACHLAEAKAHCKRAGRSFKDWCARELRDKEGSRLLGYNEAVRLAKAGDSGDPEKVKLALADKRAKTAARTRKSRAKDKVALRSATLEAHKQELQAIRADQATRAGDLERAWVEAPETLPALVQRVAAQLANATTAAEILAAAETAGAIYDIAKRAARLARAKQAHDELVVAAWKTQGDAVEIEVRAKRRLADEYDAAQERGEVATAGGDRSKLRDENFATVASLVDRIRELQEEIEYPDAGPERLHGGTKLNADRRSTLSLTQAESLTGISQQRPLNIQELIRHGLESQICTYYSRSDYFTDIRDYICELEREGAAS